MNPRRRVFLIVSLSFWTAVGLLCGMQIYISMIHHGHQLWRLLLYQVLIWTAWMAFSPLIGAVVRRHPLLPPTRRAVLTHILVALVLGVVHSVWWSMLNVVMRPYDGMGADSLLEAFRWTAPSALPQQLVVYCGVLAAHYAVDYYDKYRERERAAMRLEVSLAEARLHALDLQLRPHFLFNTLNSISALVRIARQREATAMIAGLSDLLRYSLDHSNQQQVTLAQELAITEAYLEIERLRFPDRMTFEVVADPEVRRAAVPTLLLQPLVENAVRHGIAPLAEPGTRARGSTVALNVRGVPYPVVEARAREANVAVRGGCFCNPGAAEAAFGLGRGELAACIDALGADVGPMQVAAWLGREVGAVRISLGLANNARDVDRALEVVAGIS